jgi:hypothetical protein
MLLSAGFMSAEASRVTQAISQQASTARSMQSTEQLNACLVVRIIRQRGGYQRPGVADDQAERPNPSLSRSPDRAATSSAEPSAAPNQAGGHGRSLTDRR